MSNQDSVVARLARVHELVAASVRTHPDIEARAALRNALAELENLRERVLEQETDNMADVHQIPDLARGRTFAARLRASDDEGAAALLATPEGEWFFAECSPYTDAATRTRIVKVLCRAGVLEQEAAR